MKDETGHLRRGLTSVEYFTFGFGTMVGVGWVVLMDDWLGARRAGRRVSRLPAGRAAAPSGRPDLRADGAARSRTPGRRSPTRKASSRRRVGFAAAWTMVLAYAIVCPWEAVAIGNLLARLFPAMNDVPLYAVAGKTITAPRLAAGLLLTAAVAAINIRRHPARPASSRTLLTFGLLALFAVFTALGPSARETRRTWRRSSRGPGGSGALLSILLVLQIVPYFMTGFESIGKESEEARAGFDPRGFGRAILARRRIRHRLLLPRSLPRFRSFSPGRSSSRAISGPRPRSSAPSPRAGWRA